MVNADISIPYSSGTAEKPLHVNIYRSFAPQATRSAVASLKAQSRKRLSWQSELIIGKKPHSSNLFVIGIEGYGVVRHPRAIAPVLISKNCILPLRASIAL